MPDLFIGSREAARKTAEKAKETYGGEATELTDFEVDITKKEYYGFVYVEHSTPVKAYYGVEHESRAGTFLANAMIL